MVNHSTVIGCTNFTPSQIKENILSLYHAPANELAEAFSKILCTIVRKIVDRNKNIWQDKLPQALWLWT